MEKVPTPPTNSAAKAAPEAEEATAMDLELVSQELMGYLEYIQDSRTDFESTPDMKAWIDSSHTIIEKAKKAVRNLQVDFIENLVEWKDEAGAVHEVLLRDQDQVRFDEAASLVEKAETVFDEYIKKHIEYLRQHPEKLQ